MNIRRNVLMIVYVLSVSMILSGCDSGGGHTANEQEDLYVSDVNEVVVNEEEKTVEPRDHYWINEDLTNRSIPWDKNFTVVPIYGKNLNLSVKNYSSSRISFIIYMDGKKNKEIILKGNEGKAFSYTIYKGTDFRVVLSPYGGDSNFSASIRARQF